MARQYAIFLSWKRSADMKKRKPTNPPPRPITLKDARRELAEDLEYCRSCGVPLYEGQRPDCRSCADYWRNVAWLDDPHDFSD